MFCCVVVFYLFGFILIAGGYSTSVPRKSGLTNSDNDIIQAPGPTQRPNINIGYSTSVPRKSGFTNSDNDIIQAPGPTQRPNINIGYSTSVPRKSGLTNSENGTIQAPGPTQRPNINIAPESTKIANTNIDILWIGIGIAVFTIVVIIQTICIIIYTRKVKVARRTIEDIIRSKALTRDDSKARYSKTPGKVNKRPESAEASHYESLPELDKINKKPPPPPLETLPRVQHSNPLPEPLATPSFHRIPPRPGPANYFHQTTSMPRSRERLPTPKELGYGRDIKSQRSRSPMPLPHEVLPVKPSTLPTRSRVDSFNVRPKPVLPHTMVPGENAELLSKLKRRAAMNETSPSSTCSVSPPTFPKPFSQQTKKIAPAPSLKLPRPRYENDSDEEWTIEHLKPLNLYNV